MINRLPVDWESLKLAEEWDPWWHPEGPKWTGFWDPLLPLNTYLQSKGQRLLEVLSLRPTAQPKPVSQDDRVPILQEMTHELAQQTSALLNLPINTTTLSLPAFFERGDMGAFLEAQRRVGLGRFQVPPHRPPGAIDNAHPIRGCADVPNISSCDEGVLYAVIGYDRAGLTVSLNLAQDAFAELVKSATFVDLGAGAQPRLVNPEKYWQTVRHHLEDSLKPDPDSTPPLSRLVLHGENATDRSFLHLLREVFGSNEPTKEDDYVKSAEEHLFVAARGAAKTARVGMETRFIGCIPRWDWCPKLDSSGLKDEL